MEASRGPTEYRTRGWWRDERLDDLVLRHAAESSGRPAVLGPHPLTHAQLAAAVDAVAARLQGLGVRAPSPVLVQLPNSIGMLVLTLALIRAGCPPILAHPSLRSHELDPVVADLAPAAMAVPAAGEVFDHPAMARDLQERHPGLRTLLVDGPARAAGEVALGCLLAPRAAPERRVHAADPSETALYFLSSGTTGPPKPIPRSHEALGSVVRNAAAVSGLGPGSVYLAALPVTHSFTCAHPGVLGALASGGAVVLAESADIEHLVELVEEAGVTHTALVPPLVAQLLAHAPPAGPGDARVLQVGGARLDAETARRVPAEIGWRLQQVYGMSEGLLCFTRLDDPQEVVAGTQGRPVASGDELLVVGEDGRPVAPGEQGELWTRGPSTVTAYAGRAAAEAGRFGPEGHYRTGDLVRVGEDGNVVVTGRLKDVVNRAGEKVPADDVEAVAARHPGVREVAVVGFPHPLYGEGVCAFVVPEEAGEERLTLRRLRRFLGAEGLAAYKFPDRLVLVEALPRIGVGKVDKAALRSAAEQEAPHLPAPSGAARPSDSAASEGAAVGT